MQLQVIYFNMQELGPAIRSNGPLRQVMILSKPHPNDLDLRHPIWTLLQGWAQGPGEAERGWSHQLSDCGCLCIDLRLVARIAPLISNSATSSNIIKFQPHQSEK